MNTNRIHPEERRLKQRLQAAEPLVADSDHVSVGQLVALLELLAGGGGGHLLLEVECHVTMSRTISSSAVVLNLLPRSFKIFIW